MCLISVPNLKEINLGEGYFSWLKVIVVNKNKNVKKIRQFSEMHILQTIYLIFSNLVCIVMYIETIKYANLIEIGLEI